MHFGWADPCDCPKCGQLDSVISVSGRSAFALPPDNPFNMRNVYKVAICPIGLCGLISDQSLLTVKGHIGAWIQQLYKRRLYKRFPMYKVSMGNIKHGGLVKCTSSLCIKVMSLLLLSFE